MAEEAVGRRRRQLYQSDSTREELGLVKEHQKWERDNTNDDWIQIGGQWGGNYNKKMKRGDTSSSVKNGSPQNARYGGEERGGDEYRKSEHSLLDLGKYHGWTCGEIMKIKPNYVTYMRRMYG